MDFKTLPQAARLRLENLTVPACLLGRTAASCGPA